MTSSVVVVVRAAAALVMVLGVVMQFVQSTDPRHPLLYFTVNSAILAIVTLTIGLMRPTVNWLAAMRPGICAGVLLSAFVFAVAIAPSQNGGAWYAPHDDIPVRIANILLHGVGPALLLLDYLLDPPRSAQPRRLAGWWLLWPLIYFVAVAVLTAVGLGEVPYEFLDWHVVGIWAVPAVLAVGAVFWIGVWGLACLGNVRARRQSQSQRVNEPISEG